ncbi:uncharacterized protein MYCFIDRAFT_207085 [Pseudocercospora fijiensis CIRAD86]|uniref:SRR1-like domain-containing protein n=1 Tax=Pseudocercospora fijiensis (strain CIRAD86) TaxID=383855 RepID=M3AH15_PSEFD|nr:uncharacterized protein MYCFIDRAFT_207085 [Pseudocercospora fijiensis CIRAD86]EME83856.1 hypothetical protein MYCFIDRAFT_207085 [Pseudocercospora fijiensis CIRAD86]
MADDEWTYVAKSKKSQARKPANSHNPPARDLTIDSLTTEFAAKSKTWMQSSCRKALSTLLGRVRPDTGWNIRRAVCLGCGSLSRDNVECRRRSVWQMVVFMGIVKELGITEMYAQEPAFTELDEKFLGTLDVKVLGMTTGDAALGPAKEILEPEALLFEPFVDMNAGMVQELLQTDVALYIGSSMKGLIERGARAEATAASRKILASDIEAGILAKRFCDGRGVYRFPNFEVDPNIFDGMGIYWKEEKDSDDDEG